MDDLGAPLLQACAEKLCDDWHGGSRDSYHLFKARHQAESVIEVLRRRGMLNEYGIAAARAEIGDLEIYKEMRDAEANI